jgi:hypothetical protein
MSGASVSLGSMKLQFGVREIALLGIFTAVHLVITLIPYSLSFAGGGSISFGLLSAPILGFLLGPFYGGVAAILGSLIAMGLEPTIAVIGPFTLIATAAGAFSAGAFRTNLRYAIPSLFAIDMLAYLLSPIGLLVPMFIWFHFVIFLVSLLFVIPKVSMKLIESLQFRPQSNQVLGILAAWVLGIVSTTFDQATGSALGPYYFVWLLGVPASTIAGYFDLAIFVYPVERLIGSFMIAAVVVALGNALSRSNFALPLTSAGVTVLEELPEEEP